MKERFKLEAKYVADTLDEVRKWRITLDDCEDFRIFWSETLKDGFWNACNHIITMAHAVIELAKERGLSDYFLVELINGINRHLALMEMPEGVCDVDYMRYKKGHSKGYIFVV